MNVLVIGKSGTIGGWAEYISTAFEREGYTSYVFAVAGNSHLQHLKCKLYKSKQSQYEKYMVARFEKFIVKHPVDICISLCSYTVPSVLFECLRNQYPNCFNIAWVADKFDQEAQYSASLFDQIYYTDTRFMIDHNALGFESPANYMPHAVAPETFSISTQNRIDKMLLVTNRTALREQLVEAIKQPIQVCGRGWKRYKSHSRHKISPHKVALKKLPVLFRQYLAVLNIKNEDYLLHGLTQKSFEPFSCKTVVVHEAVADIDRCFEPEKEMLVFHSEEELNSIYDKLLNDSAYVKKIANAGYKRVTASHTYSHRIAEFIRAAS
ncbi:hypothetical protein MNBD_GAMMA12-526 [hydrothermal vent metagenome]|uniref:Spore protein YkvP/CgeB glycosyl transferase-like domain-containing protein n=1 Tax=hydrothermal vent metagenome TaxID=652676 RepID=A0A3B0XXM5_9ZZZZ